jgi:hypothetical protein
MSSEMPDNIRNMGVSVGTFNCPVKDSERRQSSFFAVAGIEMKFLT